MADSIVFGRDPGNADDLSVQEGAAAAKRSITRSLIPIYAPISTSDRENRSLHGSLLAIRPHERGCACIQYPPVRSSLAQRAHRLARPTRPLFARRISPASPAEVPGRAARREHRARSVPTPLLALPQVCLARARSPH